MSWLKAEASENIPSMFVTLSVFQLPMSWLNAEAERNIEYILVTCAVFQFIMLPLNVLLPPKPMFTPMSIILPGSP